MKLIFVNCYACIRNSTVGTIKIRLIALFALPTFMHATPERFLYANGPFLPMLIIAKYVGVEFMYILLSENGKNQGVRVNKATLTTWMHECILHHAVTEKIVKLKSRT